MFLFFQFQHTISNRTKLSFHSFTKGIFGVDNASFIDAIESNDVIKVDFFQKKMYFYNIIQLTGI